MAPQGRDRGGVVGQPEAAEAEVAVGRGRRPVVGRERPRRPRPPPTRAPRRPRPAPARTARETGPTAPRAAATARRGSSARPRPIALPSIRRTLDVGVVILPGQARHEGQVLQRRGIQARLAQHHPHDPRQARQHRPALGRGGRQHLLELRGAGLGAFGLQRQAGQEDQGPEVLRLLLQDLAERLPWPARPGSSGPGRAPCGSAARRCPGPCGGPRRATRSPPRPGRSRRAAGRARPAPRPCGSTT